VPGAKLTQAEEAELAALVRVLELVGFRLSIRDETSCSLSVKVRQFVPAAVTALRYLFLFLDASPVRLLERETWALRLQAPAVVS
jgi:hypothetical protein